TAESKDAVTLTRGSETKIAPVLGCAAAIHAATPSLVCSVISNCTGRCVFFCMTIAREAMRTPFDNIMDAERDKIEAAQFAVDGKIEQGEISGAMIQLQSNSDGPDLFQLQRRLLPEEVALIPRYCTPSNFVSVSMNNSFVG